MDNLDNTEEVKKRPVFLTVLAILTFIPTGIGALASLVGLLTGPLSADELEQTMAKTAPLIENYRDLGMDGLADFFAKLFKHQEYINANFYVHHLISFLCVSLGIIGVIFMLKGIKKGFHLYIIYNITSLLLIYVSVPPSDVPMALVIINLIFSALFVFLYSRNLHWMTK